MTEPLRAIVAIKQSSKRGSYDILHHVCRTRCRNGETETGVGDRLIGLETGGRFWSGLKSPPREPMFLAKVIDGGYQGGRRSQVTHRHVIISMADTANYAHAEAELRGVVQQWVTRFLPGCPAWCIAYHADKAHVHAHIVASNWNDQEQSLLDWKRRDVVFMNSLRWYRGEVEAGAGLQRAPLGTNRPNVYPLAETNLNALLALIKDAPKERVEALVEGKTLLPYFTKGGNRGYVFNGQKLTERHLSYELAKRFGVAFGQDGRQVPAKLTQRTELQRQTMFDAQFGVMDEAEYRSVEDSPIFKLSAAEWLDLNTGAMPQNRAFRRATRTALFKQARYGFAGTDDLGIRQILSLFKAILLGDASAISPKRTRNSIFSFLCDVVADLASYPSFRKQIPALGRFQELVGRLDGRPQGIGCPPAFSSVSD